MAWITPQGARLHYCAKVGIAAFFGYVLCIGERQQYGVYGAFTAALIVGTSVGEDLATSGNRVFGTLVGMASGLGMAVAFGSSVWSLAAGMALTAFIATGFGWGVPAARIGASVCAVIIAAHAGNALEYSLMRSANTLLGVGVGMLVSLLVLPVRGRDEIARGRAATLVAAAAVLDRNGRVGHDDPSALRLALLSAALALEKTAKDMARERILKEDVVGLLQQARHAQTVGLCAMASSLAAAELLATDLPGATTALVPLAEAWELSSRVAGQVRCFAGGLEPSPVRLPFDDIAARMMLSLSADSPLHLTLQGFLHELREIELTLVRAQQSGADQGLAAAPKSRSRR